MLAASLAAGAGDCGRSAGLWLKAARRAIAEGWLVSAEEMAQRAQAHRPVEADRVLLKTWALAGQPLRAVEAAHRILSSDADPGLRMEVGFELVDAAVSAGEWDKAALQLQELHSGLDADRSFEARWAIGAAEVALYRNDKDAAVALPGPRWPLHAMKPSQN